MSDTYKPKLQPLDQVLSQYDWFKQMRADQPVWYDPQLKMWHVFRYDDVQQVLTDHTRFSNAQPVDTTAPLAASPLASTLIMMDPPQHRQYRNLVHAAFTPRSVARLEQRIVQITQDLLDQAREKEQFNFVEEIAFPLPATVIGELLGVPASERNIFTRCAHELTGGRAEEEALQESFNEHGRALEYIDRLIQTRRQAPGDDILTDLINAEIDGKRLSEKELREFCLLLLLAGHETTVNLLTNTIVCLDQNPEALEEVEVSPELIPSLVEEVLRYLPPVWDIFRLSRMEVELGGQTIPPYQVILTWLASANRDEAQFPQADRFDIRREPNHHVAFGHGIHFCLGAPLARLEAKVALPMILQQLPGLRRVPDVPVKARTGIVFAIRELPVIWDKH